MKIRTIHSIHLRNNEHVQFQNRFKSLVERFTAKKLKIEALFSLFLLLLSQEIESFNIIRKSDFSKQIEKADNLRDNTFRGACDILKSAHRHFLAEVREAADRLQVVFDFYGNLADEPREGETADINKFIAELTGKYAADLNTVGLTEWIAQLKANNDAYAQLKESKTTELAIRTQLKMKQQRTKVDDSYTEITDLIGALSLVEGDANYLPFINELNALVDEYAAILAKRKGTGGEEDDPTEDKK